VDEKRQILYEYHDAPIEAHQGIARTLSRIKLKHNAELLKTEESVNANIAKK